MRAALRGGRARPAQHDQAQEAGPCATRPGSARRAPRLDQLANRPDLIWLGFGGISYDLVPLKEVARTPLVLETECVWSRFILRELPFETDPLNRERIQRAGQAKEAEERFGAQLADLTTAVSDIDAEYFRSLAPDPGRVMLRSTT